MSKIYPSFKDCFAFFLSPAIGAVIFSFILSLHGFIYDKDFQIYFFFVSLIFFHFLQLFFYSIPMAVFCFFIFYFLFFILALILERSIILFFLWWGAE